MFRTFRAMSRTDYSITRPKTDEEIKAEFRATVHRHVHKMTMSAAMLPVLLFGAGWGAMQLSHLRHSPRNPGVRRSRGHD